MNEVVDLVRREVELQQHQKERGLTDTDDGRLHAFKEAAKVAMYALDPPMVRA